MSGNTHTTVEIVFEPLNIFSCLFYSMQFKVTFLVNILTLLSCNIMFSTFA